MASKGWIGTVSSMHVDGWAIDREGRPEAVDIYVDGSLSATAQPLYDYPGAKPLSGFYHSFRPPLSYGTEIGVRSVSTGQHLSGSSKRIEMASTEWLSSKMATRVALSRHFIKGEGIEIGALTDPMPVSPDVTVRYVDRLSVDDLQKQYGDLGAAIKAPDFVADGERLETVPDQSQDFIIASHVLEHLQDPINAIKNYLRVLKPAGVLFLVLPDKRHTFDAGRMLTSVDHLVQDHELGPQISRESHFLEFAEHSPTKPEPLYDFAKRLSDEDFSIHYHTWTPTSFVSFLETIAGRYHLIMSVDIMRSSHGEFALIISKTS